MDEQSNPDSNSRAELLRKRWQSGRARLKSLLPFAGGVIAALLGLLLYNTLFPPPKPLSVKDVNTAVEQAMSSATPAPAYSAQVFQVIQPSLVLIQAKGADRQGHPESGLGSGVVISDTGAILTALHVVDNASEIEVVFADGTHSSATVVAAQPENDIAALQPDTLPEQVIPAVLGNPNAMRVGDEAYAIGNPFGLYGSMSAGVISGFDRSFERSESSREIKGLIQIDTAVNPGNSGGPLVNRYGEVIGIVVGILNPTQESFFIGIGFAVPITVAGGAAGAPQY